jgi:amino acid permease
MKRANFIGVSTTTIFYLLCACSGYASFGDAAPGNLLTGFGFYEPFWLVDIANVFVVIHLLGAFQVRVSIFHKICPVRIFSYAIFILQFAAIKGNQLVLRA